MKLDLHTIFQVRCDPKHNTQRSSSTILHPVTEATGRKSCSSGQQAKFVPAPFLQLGTLNLKKKLQRNIKIKILYD